MEQIIEKLKELEEYKNEKCNKRDSDCEDCKLALMLTDTMDICDFIDRSESRIRKCKCK